ncbi:hypothetical protein L484_013065 [Morus notabilis]|uniref:Uncharacterized protein n=1 Tax=Morus notabilis TaxID=981085 RepID=W9QZ66_9ROSA|nr:hypothetical protein L484_013065 [Morus notabilis]
MAIFSSFFNCFAPPSSSSSSSCRVSDDHGKSTDTSEKKVAPNDLKKTKSKSSKSSKAPIVVSYFPVNSYPSRL